jgi:putative peptidoglycan lipid II flippase
VPLIGSVLAVAANLAWNYATYRSLGHFGLALGTSVAATVNLLVLVTAFQIQIKNLLTRELFAALARIVGASLAMGVAVYFLSARLELISSHALVVRFLKALGPVAAGAAVYFLAAQVLGLDEAQTLVRRFRR